MSSPLDRISPSTRRAAALGLWSCFFRIHAGVEIADTAILDFSQRLETSVDPVIQQLSREDERPLRQRTDLVQAEPAIAFASGRALLTIVTSGDAGHQAGLQLLDMIRAHCAVHLPASPPVSLAALLGPTHGPSPYTEQRDNRALVLQGAGLVVFVILMAAMSFLLQM